MNTASSQKLCSEDREQIFSGGIYLEPLDFHTPKLILHYSPNFGFGSLGSGSSGTCH